jgi:hypothetical protein
MCFSTDYDWDAKVVTDETLPATTAVTCGECRRLIPIGEPVRHIFMQEDDWCKLDRSSERYDGRYSDDDDDAEGCPHTDEADCDFGETFDFDLCETCCQLIEAIHQHELEEGCDEAESRPACGELYDAMDRDRGPGYLAKAESLYPGITARLPHNWLCFQGD